MGLILGELVESSLKQSLIIFDHNWLRFFERPIVVLFVLLTAVSVALPAIAGYRARLRARLPASADIPGD
jgi:putative tricarboxylic transport membrane protein